MNQPKLKIGDRIRLCLNGWTHVDSKGSVGGLSAHMSFGIFTVSKVKGRKIAVFIGHDPYWPRSWVRCRG